MQGAQNLRNEAYFFRTLQCRRLQRNAADELFTASSVDDFRHSEELPPCIRRVVQ